MATLVTVRWVRGRLYLHAAEALSRGGNHQKAGRVGYFRSRCQSRVIASVAGGRTPVNGAGVDRASPYRTNAVDEGMGPWAMDLVAAQQTTIAA